MADLEIKVCEIGGVFKTDAVVCNLIDIGTTDNITLKYKEALDTYSQYEKRMEELQGLFEKELGSVLIMQGMEKPSMNLNELAEKYGVQLYKDKSDGAV